MRPLEWQQPQGCWGGDRQGRWGEMEDSEERSEDERALETRTWRTLLLMRRSDCLNWMKDDLFRDQADYWHKMLRLSPVGLSVIAWSKSGWRDRPLATCDVTWRLTWMAWHSRACTLRAAKCWRYEKRFMGKVMHSSAKSKFTVCWKHLVTGYVSTTDYRSRYTISSCFTPLRRAGRPGFSPGTPIFSPTLSIPP